MFRKLLFGATIMLTCYFTGCAGRYGIPHHTSYQLSEYQHLYTATQKSVERKLISANLSKGRFVVGKIVTLGTPEIEEGGYIRTVYETCTLSVYYVDKSVSAEAGVVEIPMGISFYYPTPQTHHISEGDLIVVKLGRHIPNREYIFFYCNYVRNLSTGWRRYELPLTQ